MAHIHETPGSHDLTVSAFILLRADGEYKVLLHQHKKLGLWFQPGGHVELHENPWQAIAREIREEAGYEFDQLLVFQRGPELVSIDEIIHPTPLLFRSHKYIGAEPTHYHTDATFGFLATAAPVHAPAAGESQILKWFSLNELLELKENIHPDIRKIAITLIEKAESFTTYEASDFDLAYPEYTTA